MKSRIYAIAGTAAALLTSAAAQAAGDYNVWNLKAGIFMPTSTEMRDLFGDTWLSMGITPGQKVFTDKWTFGGDIGLIWANRGGNRLLLVPGTVGFSRRFSSGKETVVPYAAIRAGVAYYDYSITRPLGPTFTRTKFNTTANAELGLVVSQKLTLGARYDWFAKSDDFQFDGLTLWAQLTLFQF